MNITWTGKQEYILHPKQKEQIDEKVGKLSRLLETDGRSDKQARIALFQDKNRHRAEIVLNYLDHTIVGEHMDGDQFTALNVAFERLERQIMKVRNKRRDVHKGPREAWDRGSAANTVTEAEPRNPEGVPASNSDRPRCFRVAPDDTKPMSAEEAMLLIDDDEPYMVYQDSGTNRLAVIIRRDDGNFDLVAC